MNWPLPLTVMEKLLLAEDRPGYPWLIFFRLRFSGRLDEGAVRAATQAVLPRHPLFGAIVRRTTFGGWQWIEAKDKEPSFESLPRTEGDAFPRATFLDLTKEIGLRVRLVSDEYSTDVVFQVHHAVTDGLGMMGFLMDWLIAYAKEIGVAPIDLEFPRLDESRLPRRGTFGLTVRRFMRMFRKQLVGLDGVRQFLSNKPTPLFPHKPKASHSTPNSRYPVIRTHYFTAEETAGMSRAAKQRNVSMNDQLIRDFLLAISEWQRFHGVYLEDDLIRLMVPVSMRAREDFRMSAANMVSSIFIDRRGREGEDPNELLRTIHEEMQLIKRNELGFTLIFSLKLQDNLPGRIAGSVKGEKCTVSSILTNLGSVLGRCPLPHDNGRIVVGNAILENFDAVAPLRPYLAASFAIATYADRLGFTMQYDPDVINDSMAEELVEAFATAARGTASSIAISHANVTG